MSQLSGWSCDPEANASDAGMWAKPSEETFMAMNEYQKVSVFTGIVHVSAASQRCTSATSRITQHTILSHSLTLTLQVNHVTYDCALPTCPHTIVDSLLAVLLRDVAACR